MDSHDSSNMGTFFALLRSGMYGQPIPDHLLPDHIDWPSILEIARRQTVTGLIIDSIGRLPERLRPTAPLSGKLDDFALLLIRSNAVIDRAAIRLVAFLESHGIKGVLLKGQGVARSYYPVPQLRQCGDVDYYVGQKQFRKAVEICRKELMHGDDNDDLIDEKHLHFTLDGVSIEIHRLAAHILTPVRGGRFQKWIVSQLENPANTRTMTFGSTEITLPSYDFDALYIFQHAWHHFITGGIGLRQLCDWALVLHTHYDDIDIPQLEANLRRFGLAKGWKLFACILVNHLGVSPDRIPLYDPSYSAKSEEILDEIMRNGNFGYYSESDVRTSEVRHGLRYGLGRMRNIFGYFFSLFPIIPVDATCMFIHRITYGSAAYTARNISKFRKYHSSAQHKQ